MTTKIDNSLEQHRLFWAQAYQDYMQRLIAFALKLANGRNFEAEDLVQETFCRALTYAKNPEEIRSPFGYLLIILHRVWIDKWHKEGKAKTESLDEMLSNESQQKQYRSVEPAVEPDALRNLENDELRAELRANQGPLTPREKFLLALHLEGYTCKEIASELNEDAALVSTDLNAIRTKVRTRLMKARESKQS
jgi:RNA polymerase sigma factor (sigma-70 family)